MRPSATTLLGESLLTLGLVVLLFAGYELWGTGLATAQAQDRLADALERRWALAEPVAAEPAGPAGPPAAVGEPILRLHVPAFGEGWVRTVLEGVDQSVLADGPGHYPGTGLPGEPGNVAVAGHRVGHGGPFEPAGDLRSCDALVLETGTAWYVYRVLPMVDEVAGWAGLQAADPRCREVVPLGGSYTGLPGRRIVPPSRVGVVAPVPDRPGETPSVGLLTLTTCHPRYSAQQRLVVHAVLTDRLDRSAAPPDALREG